jgi:hypothetical protein
LHTGGTDRALASDVRARVRRWDVTVAAWVLVCLALSAWTAIEISGLHSLTDTLDSSSRALGTTAGVLRQLEGAPFVGDDIGAIAGGIEDTAGTARRNAAEARESIARLAALIGISIFVLAATPPAVAYLTVRRSWVRFSDEVADRVDPAS